MAERFVLAVRFFVRPPHERAALQLVESVVGRAAQVVVSRVKPYWKDPSLVEILVEGDAEDGSPDRFSQVVSDLGGGWEVLREGGDADWNDWTPGASSAVPGARWGHVMFFSSSERAPAGPVD